VDLTAYIQMVAVVGEHTKLMLTHNENRSIIPYVCKSAHVLLGTNLLGPSLSPCTHFSQFVAPLTLIVSHVFQYRQKRGIWGPAQIHDKPAITTTRLELWSYYLYYIGNNGLSGFNLGPSQFQNLLFLAGYDPSNEPFTTPCGTGSCVLPYLGRVRDSEYSISPNSCLN